MIPVMTLEIDFTTLFIDNDISASSPRMSANFNTSVAFVSISEPRSLLNESWGVYLPHWHMTSYSTSVERNIPGPARILFLLILVWREITPVLWSVVESLCCLVSEEWVGIAHFLYNMMPVISILSYCIIKKSDNKNYLFIYIIWV